MLELDLEDARPALARQRAELEHEKRTVARYVDAERRGGDQR